MIFLRFPVFVTLLLVMFALPAVAEIKPVFRNFIWGVGKDDVRAFESARLYKEEVNSLYFVEKPDTFNRTIRYDFRDGKMWRAYYGVTELHYPDPMNIFQEGAKMQVALEKIYGEPSAEEILWIRERYRPYPQRLGVALRSGDVRVRTTWMLPESKVVMEFYHDVLGYQLHYTVEEITKAAAAPTRNILDLPLDERGQP